MPLRDVVNRLTKPVEELDRQKLATFCGQLGVTMIGDVTLRHPARVAGEVKAVRIVPRAGAPALEVTVGDGHHSLTAVFLGRRKIPGMSPGRRLVLDGVPGKDHNQVVVYNPKYQFLP
jgi:hypothetical protein